MKRVEIEWLDSLVIDGGLWIDADMIDEDDRDQMLHRSVGYLVSESDETLVLATSYMCDQEQKIGGVNVIPKRCVLSIHELRRR